MEMAASEVAEWLIVQMRFLRLQMRETQLQIARGSDVTWSAAKVLVCESVKQQTLEQVSEINVF
jgi:hypothetical protein